VTPELIGLLAAALILASAVPQFRELSHSGAEGVSLLSWLLLLGTTTVWLAYGFKIGSLSTVVGNAGGMTAFAILVSRLLFVRTRRLFVALAVVPGVVIGLALAFVLPTAVAGAIGVVLGISLAMPQLFSSIHTWRHDESSAVALGSWMFLFSGQVLWLIYGVIAVQPAIVVVNATAALIGATVLMLEVRIRSRAQAPGFSPALRMEPATDPV